MDRPLPHNLEAERAILGIAIAQNSALFDASHLVSKADFFEPWHGELWSLLRDMIETGREATPATLLHDMTQDTDIGGISAGDYLRQLQADAPHHSTIKTFARTVKDLAMRRRFIEVAKLHLDEAYSAPATTTAQEIEGRYHAAASTLFATVQEAGLQPIEDVSRAVLTTAQKALQGQRRLGLSTGLKQLDDLIGPLLGGRLYSLTGPSGSGKTALAWQIARYVAEQQMALPEEERGSVLVNTIEMDGEELVTRDLTGLTGISGEKIERADMSEGEFEQVVYAAQDHQYKLPLFLDSSKHPTVGSIRGKAMRLKRLKGLKLLVIDHLRYLAPTGRPKDVFEQQHYDLQALNAIGDDLDIPVLLLCQLKSSYAADLKFPNLREPNIGDIFNGAVIEQESDVVMIVHREEYMLARMEPPISDAKHGDWITRMQAARGRAKLLLNKRRGGHGYGSRIVGFNGPTQRFSDQPPAQDFMWMPSDDQIPLQLA